MKVFFENVASNDAFNLRTNESYKRSLSDHSDLTFDEKRAYRLGLIHVSTRFHEQEQGLQSLNFTMPTPPPSSGMLNISFHFIHINYLQLLK